jgi:hypothetical protein
MDFLLLSALCLHLIGIQALGVSCCQVKYICVLWQDTYNTAYEVDRKRALGIFFSFHGVTPSDCVPGPVTGTGRS